MFHPNLLTCKNCRNPFQEVTYNSDDPPIDLIPKNKNILIKDENENLSKPVEIFFPVAENDQCTLQSNYLPESSLPQLKAQLGNTEFGTINVTPSLDTCSTHNFLAMKVFNTIQNKEKFILKIMIN